MLYEKVKSVNGHDKSQTLSVLVRYINSVATHSNSRSRCYEWFLWTPVQRNATTRASLYRITTGKRRTTQFRQWKSWESIGQPWQRAGTQLSRRVSFTETIFPCYLGNITYLPSCRSGWSGSKASKCILNGCAARRICAVHGRTITSVTKRKRRAKVREIEITCARDRDAEGAEGV